jgi:hypothetical protein
MILGMAALARPPGENVTRPGAHEIDTAARRRVPSALPHAWEHREKTGRDYGVDLEVELFDSGDATGTFLLFQVKGTTADLGDSGAEIPFDLEVKTLKYAELFVAPFVLALSPVNVDPPRFFFLWLQEYVRVVLDADNPGWRDNKRSVRVKIPRRNLMPGTESRMAFIANFPRRLAGWAQVGRIQHGLRWAGQWAANADDEAGAAEAQRYLDLMDEARALPGLFDDPDWWWGEAILRGAIDPGRRAAQLLLRGGPFTMEDVTDLAPVGFVGEEQPPDLPWITIRVQLERSAQELSSGLAAGNDYRLKRELWKVRREHDF